MKRIPTSRAMWVRLDSVPLVDCSRRRFTGNTCNDAHCPKHQPEAYADILGKHRMGG